MTEQSTQPSASSARWLIRILIALVLFAAGAYLLDYVQQTRRNAAVAALKELEGARKNRQEVHQAVFGGATPSETADNGLFILKERWSYRTVLWNYVVDVTYVKPLPLAPDDQVNLADAIFTDYREHDIVQFFGDEEPLSKEDEFVPVPEFIPQSSPEK